MDNQTNSCLMFSQMTISDLLNIVALIVIPIVAVLIGRWLQNRADKRKDKMQIFKTLMIARVYGWTVDSVNAMNLIDIIFADEVVVRREWKSYYSKLCTEKTSFTEEELQEIMQAEYAMLQEMAKSLGYKKDIAWEAVHTLYKPKGMEAQMNANQMNQERYAQLLGMMTEAGPRVFGQKTSETVKENEEVQQLDG